MLINFYKKILADPNEIRYCLADSSLEQLVSGAYNPHQIIDRTIFELFKILFVKLIFQYYHCDINRECLFLSDS